MHRGKVLQVVVKRSRLSVKLITERADYDRTTFYKHIMEPDLSFVILERYGKAIGYDFSSDFPEMIKYISFDDPKSPNNTALTYEDILKQRDQWRDKYYYLLEKYNQLIEEKMDMLVDEKQDANI